MPVWMRHQEAAAYLGLSVWTLASMRVRGDGPRLIAYRKDDLDIWLQSRRCQRTTDPVPPPVLPASPEHALPELAAEMTPEASPAVEVRVAICHGPADSNQLRHWRWLWTRLLAADELKKTAPSGNGPGEAAQG